MEAQLNRLLTAYLIENGIHPLAAPQITAADILENMREMESQLVSQASAQGVVDQQSVGQEAQEKEVQETVEEATKDSVQGPVEPPEISTVEQRVRPSEISTVQQQPISPVLEASQSASQMPLPPTPKNKKKRPVPDTTDDDDYDLPIKKQRRSNFESPPNPTLPLTQLAALTPSNRAHSLNPPSKYQDFLSNYLTHTALRFAAVATMLMRLDRVGDALAIGRFGVDLLGPKIWKIAVQYFETIDEHENDLADAKECLRDSLDVLKKYDRGLERKLHRVVAATAMHVDRSMNVQA